MIARPILQQVAQRLALSLAAALGAALCGHAAAGDAPSLRGDVVVQQDVLTVADLIEGGLSGIGSTPVFRAPALGQTGTIQTKRLVEAAAALGLPAIDTGGRLQISVTRAARRVSTGDLEAALVRALSAQFGIDPGSSGIVFDGAAPALVLPPDAKGEVGAADIAYDKRSRRVAATIWAGPAATDRRTSLRVSGTVVDLVEVAVLTRTLDRGDTVKAADVSIERRPREVVLPDTQLDGSPLAGRVARRGLPAGSLVRNGDLIRPELVGRGDVVTVVYEVPGMMLSMRARAVEAGALGDTVSVLNAGSKKTVQAVVVAAGKVSVATGRAERVVASAAPGQP